MVLLCIHVAVVIPCYRWNVLLPFNFRRGNVLFSYETPEMVVITTVQQG